jgi:Multicopper oxidase
MHIGANVGEVIIAARYGPSLGEYMLHCHNNVHEDHEMMRAFMVSWTCAVLKAHHRKQPQAGCGAFAAFKECTSPQRICIATLSQP